MKKTSLLALFSSIALAAVMSGCLTESLGGADLTSGYWEFSWNVPKTGGDYACFAPLYRTDTSAYGVQELQLNVRWINDNVEGVTTTQKSGRWRGPTSGWLTDLAVMGGSRQYVSGPTTNYGFPESDYDFVWATSWTGDRLGQAYTSGVGYYVRYPTAPGEVKSFHLYDSGNRVYCRVYVETYSDIEILSNEYFHEG